MGSAIVVGAGVFGAALARELAGRGWDVTLVDPRPPGHPHATSGGESRLLRCSHGADAWHTRSARRARELWLELGNDLYLERGLAWLAHGEGGWEDASERVLRAEGVPVERLDPSDAARLLPALAPEGLSHVILEPEAGVLRAARATAELARQAVERGARLVKAAARPAGETVDAGGKRLEADRVVWACGPWLAALFPGVVDLRVTRQETAFFEAGPGWENAAAWVDYDEAAYGTGDLDGDGVIKVAPDAEGPPFDPDAGAREPSGSSERRAREYLGRRFPALADAPLAAVTVCQYELTADTRFIAAPHPEHPSVWIYGGGSGHGFKHGPALAERMAGWVAGEAPPEPMFGLEARAADVKLRTAGLRAEPGAR